MKKKSKFEFKVKPETRWYYIYSTGELSCAYSKTRQPNSARAGRSSRSSEFWPPLFWEGIWNG